MFSYAWASKKLPQEYVRLTVSFHQSLEQIDMALPTKAV